MPLAAVNLQAIILDCDSDGVLAQLVERLNGIEEVRGSNPLGSTIQLVEF
jgi:hypothetical protein